MQNDSLKKLYVDELKDLYSAENQLVKALPKMAKAASSEKLRQGFEGHLEQTKGHVQRLEKIFQSLDESPKGKKCVGMEGLVKEGSEAMEFSVRSTTQGLATSTVMCAKTSRLVLRGVALSEWTHFFARAFTSALPEWRLPAFSNRHCGTRFHPQRYISPCQLGSFWVTWPWPPLPLVE